MPALGTRDYWQTKPTQGAPPLQLRASRQGLPGSDRGHVSPSGSHTFPQQARAEAQPSGATPQSGGVAHTPPLHCSPLPHGVKSGWTAQLTGSDPPGCFLCFFL